MTVPVSAAPPPPRRVFVTGALGFMGRAVARRYRDLGAEVRGVDRVADGALGVVAGDTSRRGPWMSHAEGCDLVVHTAALVSLSGDDEQFWRVNVLGTRLSLDAAIEGGAARFIHISSVTAYSFRFPDGVDEHYPVRVNGSPYVDTKVTSEQVVLQAHAAGEIGCTVIRPGDVYGPGSRPWVVVPVAMMRTRRFALPGRGEGIFSPVFIENLVDAVVLAGGSARAAGHVVNVTDGIGVPNLEYFGAIAAMAGASLRTVPAPALRAVARVAARASRITGRPTEINPFTVAYLGRTGTYSIAKARDLLEYEPRVSLAEGLAITRDWVLGQRSGDG